jgi:S1-C subfamily serine protease
MEWGMSEPQIFQPSTDQPDAISPDPTWQPNEAVIPAVEPTPEQLASSRQPAYSPYPYRPEPYQPPAYQPASYQPPPYQPGAGYFGYQQPKAPSPRRVTGGRWWMAALVLATALISSGVSVTGAYLVYEANSSPAPAKQVGTVPANAAALPSANTQAAPVSLTVSQDVVKVAAAVAPSVVTITTTGTVSNGFRSAGFSGSGSGFIVSANGRIITNNHVVAGTNSLTVLLSDGRSLPATVVKTNPAADLALISIKATGLTPVALGSNANIQVGQLAIAVGNPEGTFAETVTSGIISGLDRSITVGDSSTGSSEDLVGLLQTDAAINPGNSGGPLLDANGTVVGVVTASSSSAQGIGFAIPVDEVKALITSAA